MQIRCNFPPKNLTCAANIKSSTSAIPINFSASNENIFAPLSSWRSGSLTTALLYWLDWAAARPIKFIIIITIIIHSRTSSSIPANKARRHSLKLWKVRHLALKRRRASAHRCVCSGASCLWGLGWADRCSEPNCLRSLWLQSKKVLFFISHKRMSSA